MTEEERKLLRAFIGAREEHGHHPAALTSHAMWRCAASRRPAAKLPMPCCVSLKRRAHPGAPPL